jgi:hypothetical protein
MEKLKDHLDKPEKQDHEEPTKTGHWCGSKFLKSFCAKTLQVNYAINGFFGLKNLDSYFYYCKLITILNFIKHLIAYFGP